MDQIATIAGTPNNPGMRAWRKIIKKICAHTIPNEPIVKNRAYNVKV